jgi:hypothetical protein
MFHSIVFVLIIISVIITADPGPPTNTGNYAAQQPPPYNYYEYRSQQQQTPSPYAGKRNSNYPDQSSVAPTYGNVPTKSSANQCKLHINCPSK